MSLSLTKRIVDIIGSACGLVVLGPLMASVALLIMIRMGAPVIFRQTRAGLHGRQFAILKFRSMRSDRDRSGRMLGDGERVTPLGSFLRNASLDELPSLWNVLKGDMSLVGPRPLLPEYLPHYSQEHGRRHLVRPGLTGWAQVNGRQHLSFSARLNLDVWYIDNWSLWLDLRIILLTMLVVARGHGVVTGQDVEEVDDLGLYSRGVVGKIGQTREDRK